MASQGRRDLYQFVRSLGSGGGGVVELWRRKIGTEGLVASKAWREGDLVVAKRIFVGEMRKEEVEEAREEVRILKALNHPNIVKFVGTWLHRENEDLIILQEYCQRGDLAHFIADSFDAGKPFSPAQVLQWLAQLVHAVFYCHTKHQLVHRDLKPSNIFLFEDLSVRIGDFGIARMLSGSAALCQTFIGTSAYMSPEVVRMQGYGHKSDVWGLGVIMYEACTLRRLYREKNAIALMKLIAEADNAPRLPEDCGYPAELQDVVATMLLKDAEVRPSLGELLLNDAFLREAVLQLESDMEWEESLVPLKSEVHAPLDEDASQKQKLLGAFHRYDTNGDGVIDRHELACLLRELDPKWTQEKADQLLNVVDKNGDNQIQSDEFVGWLLNGQLEEWEEVKHALLVSTHVLDEESHPCVEKEDGTPHFLRHSWEIPMPAEQPASRGLSKAAEEARQRILGAGAGGSKTARDGPMEAPSLDSAEGLASAVHAAAEVTDLVQLTLRKREFEAVIARVPGLPQDPLCSNEEVREAAIDFPSWSIKQLKEYVVSNGGSLLGIAEKSDLVDLCVQLRGEGETRCQDAGSLRDVDPAVREKASVIDARLRCVDVTQSDVPDSVDLDYALQQTGKLKLAKEPCGVALCTHTHRLQMRAEDVVDSDSAALAEIEEAAEILEVARRMDTIFEEEGLQFSPREVAAPSKPLERANLRMQRVRQEKKQLGIRSTCGPFNKNLSVEQSLPLPDVKQQIAARWARPLETLRIVWSDGGSDATLQTEDDWQRCLHEQRRKDPIEIKVIVLRPLKQKASGRKARKPKRAAAPKRKVERESPIPTPAPAPAQANASRADLPPAGPAERPESASQPRRAKATLGGLAASSAKRAARPVSRSGR